MTIQVQAGLLGLVAGGDEPSHQIDQEVDRAAMARMLDLTDVLELVVDRLDDRPFAQQQLVGDVDQPVVPVLAQQKLIGEQQQAIVHLFAQLRDEAQALGDEQLLG